jgi:hypothetical protein
MPFEGNETFARGQMHRDGVVVGFVGFGRRVETDHRTGEYQTRDGRDDEHRGPHRAPAAREEDHRVFSDVVLACVNKSR